MSARVRHALAAAIRDHGPITFAEFMELSLYGPGGYYERPPVGGQGDFVTSPHVHPVFGRLLGAAIRELHEALGAPEPFRLQEVGGGDGTLARQLLDALAPLDLDPVIVERSPGARAALSSIPGVRVADELEPGSHVVLAHELLDNLPFRRVRETENGPVEVRVGLADDGDPIEVLVDAGASLREAATGMEIGEETVVPDGALRLIDDVALSIERGYVLVVDYGGVGSAGGDPHGYRDHRLVADPLVDPGEIDVTAGVDFELISNRAGRHGMYAFPSVTQHAALTALGYGRWARGERDRQVGLLGRREGAAAVAVWSDRGRASLLVDPSALGRHRWLLLATPGLPEPAWHRAARSLR